MILDDLFTFASQNFAPNKTSVSVMASVTTNRTGGLQTQANSASATNDLRLTYAPSSIVVLREVPASFRSEALTILAPLLERPSYQVSWQGSNFAAATVDATTNVIHVVLGTEFVTVALCNVLAQPVLL
jgi:hypothetical protein